MHRSMHGMQQYQPAKMKNSLSKNCFKLPPFSKKNLLAFFSKKMSKIKFHFEV